MPLPPPHTPQRKKTIYLSRDQALRCRTLRDIGWAYEAIAQRLDITQRQVQHACTSRDQSTPKKRSGRPVTITPEQTQTLVQYICSSRTARRMSYLELATGPFADWGLGQYTIRHALRKEGFTRYVARAKPPLSPVNKQTRLRWAREP